MGGKLHIHKSLSLKAIEITDGFWKERIELVRNVTIPHIWDALNDRIPGIPKSGAVNNFCVASGLKEGDFYGLVSQDSDLFKWLEAASYCLMTMPDRKLEETIDNIIDIIGKAQQEDGYLNTYYIIKDINKRWSNLREGCELYCAGHLIEAAVAYFRCTGKTKFLNIACKYADHIGEIFGREDGKKRGYCGHAEIELALVRLYHATQKEKYLELSKYFVDERGRKPYYFEIEKRLMNNEKDILKNLVYMLEEKDFKHSQSHIPVRQQQDAEGHCVKAMYLYSAMAEIAMEYGDEELVSVLKRLWESVTERRMYITGGIGSSGYGEMFTFDYDLPNDAAYAETCASIGLVFWAYRMLLMERDAKYADTMEIALYNGVLSGLSLEGTKFFYTNPLEIWPEACDNRKDREHIATQRQSWFECPCCPPNISRLIASLGQYIYTYSDHEIYIHLYISGHADFNISVGKVRIIQKTDYPWDGRICISIDTQQKEEFVLACRIPGWCSRFNVMVNGEKVDADNIMENGYIKIKRVWSGNDRVELNMQMEVKRIHANPRVRYNGGKTALMRGPIVYCIEEVDNGCFLSSISINRDGAIKARYEKDLLGGVVTLEAEGTRSFNGDNELYSSSALSSQPIWIKAVPYYSWCNRKPGEMIVWINER